MIIKGGKIVKIAKLVTGIISVSAPVLGWILYSLYFKEFGYSDDGNIIVNSLMIVGGIVMLHTLKSDNNNGIVGSLVIFFLAAIFGYKYVGFLSLSLIDQSGDLLFITRWCLAVGILNLVDLGMKNKNSTIKTTETTKLFQEQTKSTSEEGGTILDKLDLSMQILYLPADPKKCDLNILHNLEYAEEIHVPGEYITINGKMFSNCLKLKKIYLEQGVVEIRDLAMCNNPQLEEVYLPKSLLRISEESLHNNKKACKIHTPLSYFDWKDRFADISKTDYDIIYNNVYDDKN